MATSLAAQLQKLQPASRSVHLPRGGLPSVLFDARQAAEYDLDTIHSIGVNGLIELIEKDRRYVFRGLLMS